MKKLGIVEATMRHWQVVFLIAVLMAILGIYALFVMPRQEFPTFTIPQGLVIGAYPGATSQEVEAQLTSKVENYLFSYKEVNKKKTYSYSKNGLMIVFVELNMDDNVSDEFWSKLNHGLNNLKAQLPSGVVALYSDNDFGETSASLITLESNDKSYRELETYMDQLENRLRRIESVSKVRHYGLQKEQISVYVDKEKLTNYGINSAALMANLFSQGFTTTSGNVANELYDSPIHLSTTYGSEKDIAQQIVYYDPTGNVIRLKDIARIVREYPNPDNYITNNRNKCLLISTEMQEGRNIVQYGKDVNKVLKAFQQELPKDVTINRIADQPQVVGKSVSDFLLEMLYAIIAVILVTMLLLPLRVSAVAATSIPITIFISLGIMYLGGMELNTVTLAGLIVTLGMVVDNSIVIVDSYMDKLDHGMYRWHAASQSASEFFKAIFSATLAISITFFPFLFTMKGMMHDFVKSFPWTVTITLGISLLVAMFMIPTLQYSLIKKGFGPKVEGRKNRLDKVQNLYEKWLNRSFRHPKTTIGCAVFALLLAVGLFFILPQRLMPSAERNQFAVEIYLPEGSSLNQTRQVSERMEGILQKDKRVKSVTAFIGTSSPRFHTAYAPNVPGKNYAQFIVNTVSEKATINMLDEYAPTYSNYFPNAYVRFKQLDYQNTVAPIEVRFSGDNLGALKNSADSLMLQLRSMPELTWLHTNFKEMTPGVKVDIDPVESNRLGINRSFVSANLMMHQSGMPMTTIWENDYPVSVILRSEQTNDSSFDNVKDEYINTFLPGVAVPLRQIAKVEPDWTQGQIVRRNGVRTISVLADVVRGKNTNRVFNKVEKVTEKLSLPKGVTVQYGGAHEFDSDVLPKVMNGLVASILIIFLILLFHFQNVSMALVVLLSSSLTLVGAVIGLLVLHLEFSVTSILGVVSLIGILVRNGIIMLDYAEMLRRKQKKTVYEAALEAGKRRMRPIFLTSMAASMGVIPMVISRSTLWSPMGAVILFGTMISMVLIVLILPVAYWLIYRGKDKKTHKKGLLQPATVTLLVCLMASVSPAFSQSSYTLDQCKALALQNNVSVKNRTLEVRSSEQVKKEAFTNYFPKINAGAATFRFNDPLIDKTIPGGNLPVYNGNPATLATATQFAYFPGFSFTGLEKGTIGLVTAVEPLFTGGRIYNGNRLAKVGVEVNHLQLAASNNQIALEAEKQYWQIVALKEKLNTLNRYLSMVDTLHKEVNDARQAGLITQNDLLKVELKQNELKMTRLKLVNGIKLAKMALCQYIGVEYQETVDVSGALPAPESPALYYTDHQAALLKRNEYKLLQKSAQAEKLRTKLQLGEYLPQVSVGVGAQYTDIDETDKKNEFVFGMVQIPISGYWEASHKLKDRHIQEQINDNLVKDNTEKLLLQMQQARNTFDEAYEQVLLAETSIRQAKENLKENDDNYKAGLIQVSDLLEAQAQLQQSSDQYTDAVINYQTSKVTYLQVCGE